MVEAVVNCQGGAGLESAELAWDPGGVHPGWGGDPWALVSWHFSRQSSHRDISRTTIRPVAPWSRPSIANVGHRRPILNLRQRPPPSTSNSRHLKGRNSLNKPGPGRAWTSGQYSWRSPVRARCSRVGHRRQWKQVMAQAHRAHRDDLSDLRREVLFNPLMHATHHR